MIPKYAVINIGSPLGVIKVPNFKGIGWLAKPRIFLNGMRGLFRHRGSISITFLVYLYSKYLV